MKEQGWSDAAAELGITPEDLAVEMDKLGWILTRVSQEEHLPSKKRHNLNN